MSFLQLSFKNWFSVRIIIDMGKCIISPVLSRAVQKGVRMVESLRKQRHSEIAQNLKHFLG